MRLVAVSIVKNEADMIEAFVRHTRTWVDHHLVFDHDSTDGTREILGALQGEGLPITLFTDQALGNLQQARSNHLVRLAVEKFEADWVLPLDADEILAGPGRQELEDFLAAGAGPGTPASLLLVNYYPVEGDDESEINPVVRLRHRQPGPSTTKKVFIPAQLARDPAIEAGKGNHALYRGGQVLPDRPLPANFFLAHYALRSPEHQVLRVVLAELQKNSRGRAHAGLDVHYRLGFQLLAEDPARFFSTVRRPAAQVRPEPVHYQGAALQYSGQAGGWPRVARALLPYLDKLAASHGAMLDGQSPSPEGSATIREFSGTSLPPPPGAEAVSRFLGFRPLEGWGEQEGPVPEAFLPPFHWAYAPVTRLAVPSAQGGPAELFAEMLTYSEHQSVGVELNGAPVARHNFARVNQLERLALRLDLRPGSNELVLRHATSLVTSHDPRQLAVIFLGLEIKPSASA
jgi:hypothetical protein